MTPKAYIEYSGNDIFRKIKNLIKNVNEIAIIQGGTSKAGKRTSKTPDEHFLQRHQTSITSFSFEPVILSIFLTYMSVST